MHLPAGLLAPLGQRLQKILSGHIVEENVFPSIPAAHHVADGTRILNPHLLWHDNTIQRNPNPSQSPSHPAVCHHTILWVDPFPDQSGNLDFNYKV
jgi:hypothetical protein